MRFEFASALRGLLVFPTKWALSKAGQTSPCASPTHLRTRRVEVRANGLAAALALDRIMSNLIYDVAASDPLTIAVVTLLLVLVALFASIIPAYPATRTDPLRAFRRNKCRDRPYKRLLRVARVC